RRRAGNFDAVRSQLAGKFWIDAGCAEQLAAIGKRLLKRALDGVGPDEDLGDFVLIEELLELAVRNGLDLRVLNPKILDQHHSEKSGKKIPNGELMLSLLGLLGRAIIRSLALLVPSVLKPEKSQEAPNRRGLCAGGLLVEHAAFARQYQCTIIREDGLSFKTLCSQLRRHRLLRCPVCRSPI